VGYFMYFSKAKGRSTLVGADAVPAKAPAATY
jgi:hypothetical protein